MASQNVSENKAIFIVVEVIRRVEIQLLYKEGKIKDPSFFDKKCIVFVTQDLSEAERAYTKVRLRASELLYHFSKKIVKASLDENSLSNGLANGEIMMEESRLENVNQHTIEELRKFIDDYDIAPFPDDGTDPEETKHYDLFADEGPYNNYRPIYVVSVTRRFIDLEILFAKKLIDSVDKYDDFDHIVTITRNKVKAFMFSEQCDLGYHPRMRCFVLGKKITKLAIDEEIPLDDEGLIKEHSIYEYDEDTPELRNLSLTRLNQLQSLNSFCSLDFALFGKPPS